MKNCFTILSHWNNESTLDAQAYLKDIFRRLPDHLQRQYVYDPSWKQTPTPSFVHLMNFVQERACLSDNFYGRLLSERDHKPRTDRYQAARRGKASAYMTVNRSVAKTISPKSRRPSSPNDKTRYACPCCSENHPLHRCELFKGKSINARRDFVRENGLCYNCLRYGHIVKHCPSERSCQAEGCTRRHHTLLHIKEMPPRPRSSPDDQTEKTQEMVEQTSSSATVSSLTDNNSRYPVRLMVVPVQVRNTHSNTPVVAYAFLDFGATRSFCSSKLCHKLKLKGVREECIIKTVNGSKSYVGDSVSLVIKGVNETKSIDAQNVLVFDSIPDVRDSIPTAEIAQVYPHFKDLNFPNFSGDVELLIGADILGRYSITENIKGPEGTPTAYHTVLGWALSGPDKNIADVNTSINHLVITAPEEPICQTCGHDFADIKANPCTTHMSIDDKQALEMMNQSVTKVDGRFQIGLLWKNKNVKLPNNYIMAEKRLMHLKRKFVNDPELFDKYKSKMHEYLENGYAEKIPASELAPTNVTWYIPHHCTQQSKFRVVFDSSAEFEGTSLNKNLLTGPNNNNLLTSIILRFRQEPIAYICDIKQMYHRIRVPPADANAQRFLWWPDDDLTKPPCQYRMLSHIFGNASSPSVAQFALRKVADDNLTNAPEDVIDIVRRAFYVDDGMPSNKHIDVTIAQIRQLTELLATGGFELTKFNSNSIDVLKSIPEDHRASEVRDLNFDQSSTSKTLGLHWNTHTDQFIINVDPEPKPPTRRGMLSMISQVFDPMGFVQPFVLPARRILQDLCELNYSWDETVTGSLRDQWECWINKLPKLNGLSIPRCYKPPDYVPTNTELHCFCDSSSSGYGACAYLRFQDDEGNIECAFVKGVSRVTPKQPLTIPRLELTSAVVAAEMANSIANDLDFEIQNIWFWTDSVSVLQFINSRSGRFKTFVANRVNKIHLLSKPSQWRHVPTSENPADIAFRGLMPDKFTKANLWFKGPDYLYQDMSN